MNSFWSSICGGVIVAIVYCLGNIFANRKSKKFEFKNYVSKVRLDAEFSIYRELFATMVIAVNDIGLLFPEGDMPYLPPEEKRGNDAGNSFMAFAQALAKNSVFIPKDNFERFESIRKKCAFLLNCFNYPRLFHCPLPQTQMEKCRETTSEIYNERDSLQNDLRKYLKKVNVL